MDTFSSYICLHCHYNHQHKDSVFNFFLHYHHHVTITLNIIITAIGEAVVQWLGCYMFAASPVIGMHCKISLMALSMILIGLMN